MKKEMLDILACPKCKAALSLTADEPEKGTADDAEIKEGTLRCETGHRFPVVDYIPRFVASDEYAASFSFEWKIHRRTQLDDERSRASLNSFLQKTGFDLNELKGKLVLDVGVGAGRYADVVQTAGAKVVGIDLSFSVDVAFENLGRREDVHLAQADIYGLPFKDETFDYIYSIGVLHHTPDAKAAFLQLPRLLKRGGRLAIWVYDAYTTGQRINRVLRSITTKLPKRLLYALCFLAIPLYWPKKIPLLGTLLQTALPSAMWKSWRWRILDTYDWYSPKYQSRHTYFEVAGWFREAGLKCIEVLEFPVSLSGKR